VRTLPNLVSRRRDELVAGIEERLRRGGLLSGSSPRLQPIAVSEQLDLVVGGARLRRGLRSNGTRITPVMSRGEEPAVVMDELSSIRHVVEEACLGLEPGSRPSRAELEHFARRVNAAMRAAGEAYEREVASTLERGETVDDPESTIALFELTEVIRVAAGAAGAVLRIRDVGTLVMLVDSCAGRRGRALAGTLDLGRGGSRAAGGVAPSGAEDGPRHDGPLVLVDGTLAERRVTLPLRLRGRLRGVLVLEPAEGVPTHDHESERARALGDRVLAALATAWSVGLLRREVEGLRAERDQRVRLVASLVHDLRGCPRYRKARGAAARAVSAGARFAIESCGEVLGVSSAPELRRALWNLRVNAARHCVTGRKVRLTVEADDATARVHVHNAGEPIPDGDRERLFVAFERGAHDGRGEASWGLGLAVVRLLAEAHGGRVTVESRPDDGTTFTLTLPLDARRRDQDGAPG